MMPARLAAVTVIGALLAWALLELNRPSGPPAVASSAAVAPPAAGQPAPAPAPIAEASLAAREPYPEVDVIRIEWLEKIEPPPGPLVDAYDALAHRANAGDAKAALRLGLALLECHRAPRAQECEGMPRDLAGRYFDWVVLGAELGLLQAQLAAAVTLPPDGFGPEPTDDAGIARMNELRATAMKWTHEAVAGGSVDAMRMLAIRYHKGTLVERDPVRAYAYTHAAMRARGAAGEQTVVEAKFLEFLARQLNTAQRNEAQRLSDSYLADPACCKL